MTEYVEVEVEDCMQTSDEAALLLIDDESHWIPFSQIEDNEEKIEEGFSGFIYITNWIYHKLGL